MKKKIVAHYDILIWALICIPLFLYGVSGFFNQNTTEFWVNFFFWAGCFISLWALIWIKSFEIYPDGDQAFFHYPPGGRNAERKIDLTWNTQIAPSEIANIEVVKLTRKGRKKYTSTRFYFNKYLKISLKSGAKKYVYVATYTDEQIKTIIDLLLKKSNQ